MGDGGSGPPGWQGAATTGASPGASAATDGGIAATTTGGPSGDSCLTGALDTDADGTPDCMDACSEDPLKTQPGDCGCGRPEPSGGTLGCESACAATDGGCSMSSDAGAPADAGMPVQDGGDPGEDPADLCAVRPLPEELRRDHGLDDVYTRYASARGVPVLASDSPQDEALRRACMLLRDLSQEPQVLETMLAEKIGLVVMGVDETSADFPEFARWGVPDSRARGLGGVPRGLCAEENIMCDTSVDRWRGESICVHEFAHTMHLGVYNVMERDFDGRVEAAYRAAMDAGKYQNTYAASNAVEYFAEAVQDWYNTNLERSRPDGVHNHINTRKELLEYDPAVYEILAEVLPDEPGYQDCYHYE